jgi:TetR/AcrR family transcriptional regulator, cholesterol catabolism regulator
MLGQRSGEFDPALDARQCGQLLRDAYFGALYRWSRNGGGPLARELEAIFELVLSGVAVRPSVR